MKANIGSVNHKNGILSIFYSRIMKIRLTVTIMVVIAVLLSCQKKKDKAGLVPFRISYSRSIDDLPLFVGIEEGFFEEQGLKIELVTFDRTANALAAMFKGEIEGGQASFYDIVFAAQKKLPVKAVTWFGRAHPGTRCGFHVRKDDSIACKEELRGKKIALGGAISSRIITFTLIKQSGLTQKDVKLILGLELNEPMKHEAALKSGRVDVILV